MQNVLSIGESLNGIAPWKKNSEMVIHCYYPKSTQSEDIIEVDYGYGGTSKMAYHKNINCAGTIKLALNQYGIWINGKLIKGDSEDEQNVPIDDTSFFEKVFASIKQCKTLTIGSYEGTHRSFQHYNEISVLHKLYTADEMAVLTTA